MERSGHLFRELNIYERLAVDFGEIVLFTYGKDEDRYLGETSSIRVVGKPISVSNRIYSIVLPFVCAAELRRVSLLKANQMPGSWAAVLAKWIFRKKLILRCGYEWEITQIRGGAGRLKRLLVHWLELISYQSADLVILTTEAMKEYVCQHFGITACKVSVLPNPIDLELFSPDPAVPKVAGRLIFIGRLAKEKNVENLLRATAGLVGVELVVVGNGPLRGLLELFAKSRQIRAKFVGIVPNEQLPKLLNSAEVFILPSLFEGNPKSLLEAMACGLPIIATPVQGVVDVVKHGVTGYLCADTTAEGLADAIQRVLPDKKLQENLGVQARKSAIEKFSMDTLIAQEVEILNRFCQA